MMFKKCSHFHWCFLRGFNFIETVYELYDNPSYTNCMTLDPVSNSSSVDVPDSGFFVAQWLISRYVHHNPHGRTLLLFDIIIVELDNMFTSNSSSGFKQRSHYLIYKTWTTRGRGLFFIFKIIYCLDCTK